VEKVEPEEKKDEDGDSAGDGTRQPRAGLGDDEEHGCGSKASKSYEAARSEAATQVRED
jgi:hypothetical protein